MIAGEVATTVLTSEIGRVIDLFQVVRLGSDRLMLISDSFDPGPLIENIDKYTILENAVLEDASPGIACIGIRGPKARAVAGEVTGDRFVVLGFTGGIYSPFRSFGERALLLKGDPLSSTIGTT